MSLSDITVVVPENNNSSKIILTKFENGKPQKRAFRDIHPTYGKDDDGNATLTIPGKQKLNYVGTYKTGKQSGSRYYIGCLDKTSGKMTIHDAEIFNMKPTFEDEDLSRTLNEEDLTYRDKMDRLTVAFGSQKKKRAVSARQQFHNLMASGAGDVVDKAMDHAVALTDSPSASRQQQDSSILPPCNRDADRADEVYTMNLLIPPDVQTSLKTYAKKFADRTQEDLTEWTKEKKFSAYVLDRMKVLPMEEEARWKKAICLSYFQCLHIILHLKPKDFNSKSFHENLLGFPESVKFYVLQQFTEKSKGDGGQRPIVCLPARLKDKMILHILALTIVIDGTQLDHGVILNDLGIAARKINQFYRHLGCKVSSGAAFLKKIETGSPTVVLKLPLQLVDETKTFKYKSGGKKKNLLTS